MYYVKEIDDRKNPDLTTTQMLGFAPTGRHIVFVGNAGRSWGIDVLAHEIGHALGLEHNQNEARPNTVVNPFNFDGTDPDLTDDLSLMWRISSGTNKHISSPFWKRLNEIKCNRFDWFNPKGMCKLYNEYDPPY